MLGRQKKNAKAVAEAEAQARAEAEAEARAAEERRRRPQPKGQPTPKRKDQEALRRRPLVPGDKKAARQAQRDQMRQMRAKQRTAMETGDEKYLPQRDRGRQRRFARDWVDARTGLGEWMLVVVLLFLFVSLVLTEDMRLVVSQLLWLLVLVVLVECWYIARTVRRRIQSAFGQMERGIRFYAVMRSLQIRRLRLPKPMVSRGEFPS